MVPSLTCSTDILTRQVDGAECIVASNTVTPEAPKSLRDPPPMNEEPQVTNLIQIMNNLALYLIMNNA